MTYLLIGCWLVAINLITYVSFGEDKQRAREGRRRIREQDLLNLAFFGGTIGAYLGRRVFRHKTRKVAFSDNLHQIAALQIGLLAAGVWFGIAA